MVKLLTGVKKFDEDSEDGGRGAPAGVVALQGNEIWDTGSLAFPKCPEKHSACALDTFKYVDLLLRLVGSLGQDANLI